MGLRTDQVKEHFKDDERVTFCETDALVGSKNVDLQEIWVVVADAEAAIEGREASFLVASWCPALDFLVGTPGFVDAKQLIEQIEKALEHA